MGCTATAEVATFSVMPLDEIESAGDALISTSTDSALDALVPGDLVGTALLVRKLGAGHRGHVWLARSESGSANADVVMRLVHPYMLADRVAARAFTRNAVLVAQVRHPAIPTIHKVG